MSNHPSFLKSLAHKCQSQFGNQCDQLTIIFPNKRAGIYFANELAQLYNHPIWSPAIMSFEEFVENKQSKNFADDLQMIFLLYKAYKQIVPHAEDFDSFFPWGEMILKDFNDIDNYLVDAKYIFRVIRSQKELDESFRDLSEHEQVIIQSFWKGFLPEPNKKQSEFIATWSILAELYEKFNLLLSDHGLVYKGRMFRDYAEHPEALPSGQSVWFAGFNALTKAEEKIIKAYLDQGRTDIFWDVDQYYFKDQNQESGFFFREYAQDKYFKPSIERDVKEKIDQSDLNIEVLAAPFGMGQIKGVAQRLADLQLPPSQQSELLIVLTDESLLQSLLYHLPAEISTINVTMGWSVSQSKVFIALTKIVVIQDKLKNNSTSGIHLNELKALLEFHDLLGISSQAVQNFESSAIAENLIYPPKSLLSTELPQLMPLIEPASDVLDLVRRLIAFITDMDLEDAGDVEQSATVLLHSTLKRLESALQEHSILLGFNSFHKLFQKLGTTLKLPLSGDPTEGIQVMGILETRNLNFEKVLIVGMNEGHWPKDSSNSSFIPFNIRKAFDLPTVEHQDAMQSYLFYRLLHSAKDLYVTYNNISEFNQNGELSRYVRQLAYESNLKIQESTLISPVVAESEPIITIEKEGATLEKLNSFLVKNKDAERRLSPSALNTYIDCKLRFYFQHIERIKEPDELLEDMDPSLFGNLLHSAMEHLYAGQNWWEAKNIHEIRAQVEPAIRQAFSDHKIDTKQVQNGRQVIAFEVIKAYMNQILDFDEKNAPFNILGLEATDYYVDFPIVTLNGSAKVGLKGIIDRIDEYKQAVRVLDYKSGRDDRKFGAMFDLIDGDSLKRNKAVFQLFYYSMLYKENHPEESRPIQPGLFNSKDLFDDKFDTLLTQVINRKSVPVLNYNDFEEEFKEVLLHLLTEMFNTSVPFTQTQDLKKCSFCTYKQICKRG